ncbi:MAG TPA: hypothetical protein PKA49_02330 [Tepidiformaceae bacterium]|nr:hypothetical protein [Tepidiformaceae bacterium]
MPIWATVRDAFHLVRRNPRETMLPLFAVELPVVIVVTALTTLLYFTAFKDEPFYIADDLFTEGSAGAVFAFLALTAVSALFSQVARAATIVSVAALIGGKRLPLSQALDPAFTRMGGLLTLAFLMFAGAVVLGVTVVGIVVLPILALRLGLTVEAFMLDGGNPFQALRRCWAVMGPGRNRAGALSGIMTPTMLRLLAVFLVIVLLVAVPVLAVNATGELARGSRTAQIWLSGLLTVLQTILLLPVFAWVSATMTSFYLQARQRADG